MFKWNLTHTSYLSFLTHILMGLFYTSAALATDMDAYFQKGLDVANANQMQASNALKSFNPALSFPNYTDHPPQTAYFSGGTQTSTTLSNDAAIASQSDPISQEIQKSFETRPQFTIDPNSPQMKNSELPLDNAVDIVNGISNEFVDCDKTQTCTTTYETKTCEEAPSSFNQYCTKTLTVSMVPKQTDTHYKLTAHLQASQHGYGAIIFNVTNGAIMDKGPSDASGSLSGRLPNLDCNTLHGQVTAVRSSCGAGLDYIYLPSCSMGMTLNFKAECSGHLNIDVDIDMVSTTTTQVPVDNWNNGCSGLENNSACTFQSENCIEANTTHTISGQPVTRACWEDEDTYSCKGGAMTNACQPLQDQGCQQVNSVCENMTDGGCTLYNQTFNCPIKSCTDNGVICNGDTYCLTGDCIDHTKVADPDFAKAASSLSAISDAASEMSQDSEIVWTGTPKSCVSDVVNFANCCSDSGWGVDNHLSSCTQEEKDLGQDKENKLTVYVGSYCDTDALGVCVTHKKSYCVFPSLLGRIVQEQGREAQLHINFGTAKHPNCGGITPDQLASINFGLIDFSEFYADLEAEVTVEDTASIDQRMEQDINNMTGGG